MTSMTHGQQAPASAPAAPPVPPPVNAAPERTTASFADWVLRCERPSLPAGAPRVCEIAQSIQIQGQQGPIAQIAVGKVQRTDPLKLTLVLPNNVTLTSAPKIAAEEAAGTPVDMPWQRCIPGACFADVLLRDDMQRRMRTSVTQGRIEFKDAGGRAITLPFSLRGFSQALDALAKE
ncbi:MAG: invasion associated locus B family protein [Rhizobiales bacterium]|nr:invasion associated locus B family protein [Hyphomicrobiales bacterium]